MSRKHEIVIAGGGTAGHVLPAVAIGQEFVRRGMPRAAVHFVGGRHGLERRLVPAAGFSLASVPGRGLPTSKSWRAIPRLVALGMGTVMAIGGLVRHRPRAVVSVGGYAAIPCGLAAVILRIPLVVVEPNAVPGRANALLARFARASATGWPGTGLPHEVVTGVPVREEILAVDRLRDRAAARSELELAPDDDVLAVVGGSLGAGAINDAVAELVTAVEPARTLVVYHVVGDRDYARMAALSAPANPHVTWRRVAYEDRMPVLLAAADVVVGRAGASFVAEVMALGIPAVLVPLPGAPGDHQTKNAAAAARATASAVVPQAELSAARLWREVLELLPANGMPAERPSGSRADGAGEVVAVVESVLAPDALGLAAR